MTRLAMALLVTVAGVTAATHHQAHRRLTSQNDVLASVVPLRASRAQERQPLPPVNRAVSPRKARHDPRGVRGARPAGVSGLSDVTMYCPTGNRNAAGRWPRIGDVAVLDRRIRFGTRLLIAGRRYVVEDWIGSGSQFDIFGGDNAGCESRALAFGRQHLRVEVVR